MLAVTVLLGWPWVSFLLTHTISFRFSELIPYKMCTTCRGCLGDGLCRWLGRSDLHGPHVKMLPVGLLFPVAERDASYLHPHLPLSLPEDTCTLWNVKETIFCEKKKPVSTVLGISSCDWWWRWRWNVSFSISASLSLFSALTLYSHAHLWSIKLSLKMRVSSTELFSTLKNFLLWLGIWKNITGSLNLRGSL